MLHIVPNEELCLCAGRAKKCGSGQLIYYMQINVRVVF